MRSAFAVITPLLLLLGSGVAEAADPTQLAETGGFLLGNARRCGVAVERVESAGKMSTQIFESGIKLISI